MDKDTDERLLPDGVFRHAMNVNINTSEESDEGSVENTLSTKKLTNINFGEDSAVEGGYSDTANNKLYWFVVSSTGAFLMEYDVSTHTTERVLADTRPASERVLNLKKGNRITGIGKIITNSEEDDLFLWTDNNMEICCINISRAKKFPENGFEKEDIYLIKKPPSNPPRILPVNLAINSSDLSQSFLTFAYRYQYLDGEYSALSPFSQCPFLPKKYNIDYFELVNKGMVNAFNALRITFETGDRRVKNIQLCFKESNSNNIYLIDTFSKKQEGLGNHATKTVNFINNKIYKLLPEKELFRTFDNIPKRAKALSLIDNRVAIGNYTDGYNFDEATPLDFSLSLNSYELDVDQQMEYEYFSPWLFVFQSPAGVEYSEGSTLIFYIEVTFDGISVYQNSFQFILSQDYPNLNSLLNSDYFQEFVTFMNIDFKSNYEWEVPMNYELIKEPELKFFYAPDGKPAFNLEPAEYRNVNTNEIIKILIGFAKIYGEDGEMSPVQLSNGSSSASCKTNQSYAVGIIYRDEFGRSSTVQIVQNNTVFIPQNLADQRNKIQVKINHKAPSWAHDYKLSVKTKPLIYQTIYINEFYNDGVFVWCKLEESNQDKVKVGDYLNVKLASGAVQIDPVKVKVLDIKSKERNFIERNETETASGDLIEIEESEGLYMKIRPTKFSMDRGDYSIYQDEDSYRRDSGTPKLYLDLQTKIDESGLKTELFIGTGASIHISLYSKRKYDKNHDDFSRKGWNEVLFEKEFFAEKDYDTIEQWFNEVLLNGNSVLATHTGTGKSTNIANLLKLRRGKYHKTLGRVFVLDSNYGLYLEYTSFYKAPSKRNRYVHIGGKITIRTSTGIYVFETDPIQAESQVYYETPETYPIIQGNHIAKINGAPKPNINQDTSTQQPAIIEMSFFNCYSQGNGVESYRVFDDFNTNFLNIDSRPSLVSSEPYREVTRYADITYGEPFIESANINGLNEFNASTANWKELNKQDGPIEVLHAREGNLLIVQRNKWGYVLFNKNALHTADGTQALTSVSNVLGEYIAYAGLFGTSNPESFAAIGTRCYAVDKERGTALRLSQDGLTEITRGMKSWFRENLSKSKESVIIGGIDPYNDNRYQITINDKPLHRSRVSTGQGVIKYNQIDEFVYNLRLEEYETEVEIQYNVTDGEITLRTPGGSSVLKGRGSLNISYKEQEEIPISITPVGKSASYELNHINVKNDSISIISVVLNNKEDKGKTITNNYKWDDSHFYSRSDLFTETPLLITEIGEQGTGKFPINGARITLQSMKSPSDTAVFDFYKGHRLMYLVTDKTYNIDQLLSEAINVRIRVENDTTSTGSFTFSRESKEKLYLIWDYTDKDINHIDK